MGLLDQIAGQVLGGGGAGGGGGGGAGALAGPLLQMLAGNGGGGLGQIVSAFTQSGMGSMVQGWISTGPNPPVSGDQVTQALGANGILEQLAAKVGLPSAIAAPLLAQVLPMIVDKLTPDGKVPDAAALEQNAQRLAGELGGG